MTLKEELEQARREMRERLFKTSGKTGDFPAQRGGSSGQERPVPTFFACESDAISETGYGEELVCICDDEDTAPWSRCPIHDAAVD